MGAAHRAATVRPAATGVRPDAALPAMTAADRARTERAALLGIAGRRPCRAPAVRPAAVAVRARSIVVARHPGLGLRGRPAVGRRDGHRPICAIRPGPLWKLLLAYRVVATAGVLWVFPTSLTWTISQLIVGLGGVVFVHLVLAFPSGHLEDRLDRRFVTSPPTPGSRSRASPGCSSGSRRRRGSASRPATRSWWRRTRPSLGCSVRSPRVLLAAALLAGVSSG